MLTTDDIAEPFIDSTGPAPAHPVHDDWLTNDIDEPLGWFDRTDGDHAVMKYTGERILLDRLTWIGRFHTNPDTGRPANEPVDIWVVR